MSGPPSPRRAGVMDLVVIGVLAFLADIVGDIAAMPVPA